jgi:L-asparaginase
MTQSASKTARPRVYVIGTGGTISFVGNSRSDIIDYPETHNNLEIEAMLARIPEAAELAEIRAEQFTNVASFELTPTHWLGLALRIGEILRGDPHVAGVVVSHGTGTLEEAAYFLNLTVRSRIPIVITGAARPPSALDTDANGNLLDAIRVAADSASGGRGALVVLNKEIHAARDVTKVDTHRLGNFKSNDLGCLGYCDADAQVVFYRTASRIHTSDSEIDVASIRELPRVDVAHVYAGYDGIGLDAMADAGAAGIIVAAIGAGRLPSALLGCLQALRRRGLKLVVATQTANGRIIANEMIRREGLLVADNLSPRKARILLMLALTATRSDDALQRMLQTY